MNAEGSLPKPSGFLLVNKPENWTTFTLIRDLRKKSGFRKIGHTGTLDPFATGLVILCVGNTTRLSDLVTGQDKEYLVEIELGKKSDTGDSTGSIIEEKGIPSLNDSKIAKAAESMLEIESQVPPRFSAIKINGQPAYKRARKGEDFRLQPRKITVHSFSISSCSDKRIVYRTRVSKGTYIRTLTEVFAERLGTVAFTSSLCRTAIGRISLEAAVSPADYHQENWQEYLKPIREILSDYQTVNLSRKQACHFLNGKSVNLSLLNAFGGHLVFIGQDIINSLPEDGETEDKAAEEPESYIVPKENDCLGWGIVDKGILYPKIVIGRVPGQMVID